MKAQDLARAELASALPRRWRHVQAVAAAAAEIGAVAGPDFDDLVSAAWLHDIGYAPVAVDTGFHPLDGARYLVRLGVRDRICGLVAHHSCAVHEAESRGLRPTLEAEFPFEAGPVTDALWYADMTTGPDGMRCAVTARLDEVTQRYGPEHVVSRSLALARPELLAAASRTLARMSESARAIQPM